MTDPTTITLLLPEIALIVAATSLYLVGAFMPLRSNATWLALIGIAVSGMLLYGLLPYFQADAATGADAGNDAISHSGPLAVDLFGYLFRWSVLAVGALLVLVMGRSPNSHQTTEVAASLLMMLSGLMLISAADDLVLLFVGLELVSIPTYILLYIGRHDARGQESTTKYFFLSILSSAVLLYGFSFLFGATGSTSLLTIHGVLANAAVPGAEVGVMAPGILMPLALLSIFAGLAFRLTAVPFHFYAPDVYQGTSNGNVAMLATLPKIAGLAVLARLAMTAMPDWESMGWKVALVISVLTMTVGNMLALWQTNLRRMLAYSSIAHAGYLLIGVAVALAMRSEEFQASGEAAKIFDGLGASIFYLLVYIAATIGTFAALVYLSRGVEVDGTPRQIDSLDDIAGLNQTHSFVALLIAGFMFSLAGIPPLAGFWGKFTLLWGALTIEEAPHVADSSLRGWFIGLAIVAALNAAIAAAYYLRIIGAMYFRSPTAIETDRHVVRPGPALAMVACAAIVLGIGVFPKSLIEQSNQAARSLRPESSQPVVLSAAAQSAR